VADRYFSPEEVEALIPALSDLVERLQTAHAEAETRRARLKAEHERVTLAGGGILDQARWRADREGLDAAVARAQEAIEGIHAVGGVPKDVGLGLVDFPHVRDGRVVNLCWKQGEKRIEWWHGLDEGYSARKAL
jgi:hypothetical protein